ncbi:hypothetical protein ACFQ7I_28135 [Streptomyces massasporeus]
MVQHIVMPSEEEVPPGPRRDLLQALHLLYEDAGYPGLRTLAAEINDDKSERLMGRPNREGVAGLLRGSFTTAPVWANLQALVRVLATWSHRRPDPDEEESRFHALWRAAAQPTGTQQEEADAWADDPSLYARELPYQLQDKSLSDRTLTTWHDEQRDDKARRALPAIARHVLWPDHGQGEAQEQHIFRNAIRLMGLLQEQRKPLLARIVCNAGALSYNHRSWPVALEGAGRTEDAERARELSRRHLPAAICWRYSADRINFINAYANDSSRKWRLMRSDPVWQYLVEMTVHRTPDQLVTFLASLPYRSYMDSEAAQARAFHAAVATEYDPVALTELLDHLHENGAHLLASELWNCAARGRRPLAPLLQALRDAGRSWEGTAVLRRTLAITQGYSQQPTMYDAPPLYQDQPSGQGPDDPPDLLDELLNAGLVEEADTLAHLRLVALGQRAFPQFGRSHTGNFGYS